MKSSPNAGWDAGLDVLMITHNRPDYVRLSLPRLLATVRAADRVWVWHNGDDEETLSVVREHVDQLHRFHHSRENVRLREPTQWLWDQSRGSWLSKVDDDCLVGPNWVTSLVASHTTYPAFGVLGSWRFYPEDWVPSLADRKTVTLGGTTILRNLWVQGSGYVLRRQAQVTAGPLRIGESWPAYCIRMCRRRRWVNGWPIPLVLEEHMDDPRSQHTLLTSQSAFDRYAPLSASRGGPATLDSWGQQMKDSARDVQAAPPQAWRHSGLYRRTKAIRRRRSVQ